MLFCFFVLRFVFLFKMRRILQARHVAGVFTKNYSTQKVKWRRQVFSAIQPTGTAHLGNYLGALKKWVELQDSEENPVIYALADLHSITLPQDPKELQQNIFTMVATLLACGIDTSKTILFQQSMVSQHCELNWILGTMTTMAKLGRLPQYREKCELVKDPPVGIFLYPVLQAADIMLYRTTDVPVGEDQIQQLELANHLIRIFNNKFGETFPLANVMIDSSSGRIKSLTDPKKKMSKSDPNPKSVISLLDDPAVVLLKCKRALTDFTSEVTYDPENRPGVSNLIEIHSGVTGKSPEDIVREAEGLNTGQYKLLLAEIITDHLNPIRQKVKDYLNSREYLISELEKGAEKAREIAEKSLKAVKEKVGLDIYKVKLKAGRSESSNLDEKKNTAAIN